MIPVPESPTAMTTLIIKPTTGGQLYLRVSDCISIQGLRYLISRKVKIPIDRMCLLHKDRQLISGSFSSNGLKDGSIITLLPCVESGLTSQKSERTVTQALESLSDSQIEEFLSGKAPLHLTLRLGTHMMFIQLQLSTVTSCRRVSSPCQRTLLSPSRTQRSSNSLSEASQNITNTLKKLSSVCVNHNTKAVSNDQNKVQQCDSKSSGGAVIDSMKHHGRGVFSGTFSGTLNPDLQDSTGRPRRNINTVIHILNDLLGASPQYRSHIQSNSVSSFSNVPSDSVQVSNIRIGNQSEAKKEENQATRNKMEQLQLLMKERKMRRKTRRNYRAPYCIPGFRQNSMSANTTLALSGGSSDSQSWIRPDSSLTKNIESSNGPVVNDTPQSSQYSSKLSSETIMV